MSVLRLWCQCSSPPKTGANAGLVFPCYLPASWNLHIVCSQRLVPAGTGGLSLSEGKFSTVLQLWLGFPQWIKHAVDPSGYRSSGTQHKAPSGIHYHCCWQQKWTSWVNKGERKREGASKTNQQRIKRKEKKETVFSKLPIQPTNDPTNLCLK